MTDAERRPLAGEPGAPPITLLRLITDTYTDALTRLAYAERDRHDWTSYRKLGYDLIGVGARVIVHAYARREPPADTPHEVVNPRAVAAEAARQLRTTLALAEQVAGTPASAESVAMELEALAEDCATTTGLLYRNSAGASPAAIVEINPIGEDDGSDDRSRQSGGEPA
ncbi:hypothetical protein H4696_003423 [Amycolatopsis lexingtonensis]|uniref:Uncharacterized protein n=1 Tax=Amycolatopsis lexingtonensis TaxID=218822 RepID=A0ABR9HZH3_9PSEU|nr:hypothetical protein [Amycolatopsis lexingtonensis]MBE1496323.1 hypothetical protein [Amycolatopsis lexingtonensis]